MLRQDPVECLFSFICSSNNHISRIHGMVERLCSAYGTELYLSPPTQGIHFQAPIQTSASSDLPAAAASASASSAPGAFHLPQAVQEVKSEPASDPIAASHDIQTKARSLPTHTSHAIKTESLEAHEVSVRLHPQATASGVEVKKKGVVAGQLRYYAFPTLQQLTRATEEELRAAGFG